MESWGKEIRGWLRGEGADTLGNLYNYPQKGWGRRVRRSWVTLGGRGHTHRSGEPPRAPSSSRGERERENYCHPSTIPPPPVNTTRETRACLQWLCPANVYACIKTTLSSSCLPVQGGEGILSICGPIVNRV